MATVTKTRTYSTGETLTAENYNDDRDEIITGVNSINNSQVAAAAAIAYSKLNLSGEIVAADIADNVITDAKILSTEDIKISALEYVIDGGGAAITTGIKGDLEVPFDCTINRVTMLADQSGSIVIDVWKDDYASYPPTDADSITSSAVPTITTDTDSQDSTLTGWTKAISAGDILRFNVDSITTIERVTISLKVTKT